MTHQSTIRAFQSILSQHSFLECDSFSENFAQARFKKKFQEPNQSLESALKDKAWRDWLEADQRLGGFSFEKQLWPPFWYKVRALIHEWTQGFQLGEFRLPKGSELNATRGLNSLESRLSRSDWTCTRDNFERFCSLCYYNRGFKKAVRQRFSSLGYGKAADKYLWGRYQDKRLVWRAKVWLITEIVRGGRFSTVPKNNEARRPITVEPLANILTQSMVGEGIRKILRERVGIDLDILQDVHRARIKNPNVATIDLKNASDSQTLSLVQFLLPKAILRPVLETRCDMMYGSDDSYHILHKISSMGNGFTFELMTLILTAAARVYDPNATVFGDDIIIDNQYAHSLIERLEEVGYVVNTSKSFINSSFRESCGGNYYEPEGYVKSFDFFWPNTILDCAIILNKCYLLSSYRSFNELYVKLLRCVPISLRGPAVKQLKTCFVARVESDDIPPWFMDANFEKRAKHETIRGLQYLCYGTGQRFVSFKTEEKLVSPTLQHLKERNWAKYFMYLNAGAKVKDIRSTTDIVVSHVSSVWLGNFAVRLKNLPTG